jgi:TfoX/Sxy family transcriptional regulator of competence genes
MAYDEALAQRVRAFLAGRGGLTERRMFGGLCFTVEGRMCCGVLGGDLVVRVTPGEFAEALGEPGARPMDFTGRPMKGFLFVDRRGHGSEQGLHDWLERGVRCARSQPPRKPKAPAGRRRPARAAG